MTADARFTLYADPDLIFLRCQGYIGAVVCFVVQCGCSLWTAAHNLPPEEQVAQMYNALRRYITARRYRNSVVERALQDFAETLWGLRQQSLNDTPRDLFDSELPVEIVKASLTNERPDVRDQYLEKLRGAREEAQGVSDNVAIVNNIAGRILHICETAAAIPPEQNIPGGAGGDYAEPDAEPDANQVLVINGDGGE